MNQAQFKPLNEDDYLHGELRATLRHELVSGAVYAIAGCSADHNQIAVNLASYCNLRASSPCQTFISDMKLRLDAGNLRIAVADLYRGVDFAQGA